MRAVVQRVLNASVAVDGQTISSIGKGLMVLVGIERNDTADDAAWIIKKVLGAKLWDSEAGPWKNSVVDLEGEVLCVSQFTLFANFKGLKPDFHESMSTQPGKAFYSSFLEQIRSAYVPDRIKDGQFGAMMAVSLTNDGPVTILFDSRERKKGGASGANSGASTPTNPPKKEPTKEERAAIAKAKNDARKAQKMAWEAIKAAEKAAAEAEGSSAPGASTGAQSS